jgi:iron(III) transport system ATP-binding protein
VQSLDVDQLQFRHPHGDFRLGPLDLHLPAGSRTALVGPSGCGKSTLLRLLAGLERPTSGTISIGGRVVADGPHERVSPAERKIGFVFQDGALWPHLDAVGHLRFVQPRLGDAEAVALLDRVGLADRARHRPAALSGGEAQRLSLARALAHEPEILLLDEPLGAVDVHLRDELALLVADVARDRKLTLVVVTHDRDEALAMANDLLVLRAGSIVEQGSAADLLGMPGTGFTASFLARAVCLPLAPESGRAETPFGPVDMPPGARSDSHVLAVLPGDLEIVTSAEPAQSVEAEVRHLRADGFGRRLAAVSVQGQLVPVLCGPDVALGDRLTLRFRVPPRVLPHG